MPDRSALAAAECLRPIEAPDWPAISSLEAANYGDHGLAEGEQALRTRAQPGTSFVLDLDGRIGGYVLALPYPRGSFPDLSRPEAGTHRSTNLHLHDIVIAPALRGRGWGKRLVRHVIDTAKTLRYDQISLVSVDGTAGFWVARGFRPHPHVTLPGSYGSQAVYMTRETTP